eukprot:SAG31_NODE_30776_length_376_cov_0.765343_1_plen_85_part_01
MRRATAWAACPSSGCRIALQLHAVPIAQYSFLFSFFFILFLLPSAPFCDAAELGSNGATVSVASNSLKPAVLFCSPSGVAEGYVD